MRLQLVTGNAHKLSEFGSILGDLGCRVPLEKLAVCDVVECGATYYQNAYRKAVSGFLNVQSSDRHDSIVLADDSGLELPLFDNMPGVHSARFRYADLSEKAALMAFMSEHGVLSTPARFVCCIVAFLPWSRQSLTCSGAVTGTVTPEARGSQGFGYDPLFTPDGYSLTFGEMDAGVKNHISHRAQAIRLLWHSLQGAFLLRP